MPATATGAFAQSHQSFSCVATTAVPLTGANSVATSTPSNTVLLGTAGPNGDILTALWALPLATQATDNQLMIWSSIDGGVTKRLRLTALLPSYTLAASTQNKPTPFKHADNSTLISDDYPLRLAANEELYAGIGTTLASGIVFNATTGQL